ncbi:hypothetical protein LBK30_14275 [Leptospira borgpetersenii serovar Hardjo]|nr:hypothetical protein LBK9_14265 [Leptospira borgpetersenii serovar Hardjo]AMX65927.1 hypothetical protein LBK30_14275 [Leptospira borgpetersenii serovar Hardjo]
MCKQRLDRALTQCCCLNSVKRLPKGRRFRSQHNAPIPSEFPLQSLSQVCFFWKTVLHRLSFGGRIGKGGSQILHRSLRTFETRNFFRLRSRARSWENGNRRKRSSDAGIFQKQNSNSRIYDRDRSRYRRSQCDSDDDRTRRSFWNFSIASASGSCRSRR